MGSLGTPDPARDRSGRWRRFEVAVSCGARSQGRLRSRSVMSPGWVIGGCRSSSLTVVNAAPATLRSNGHPISAADRLRCPGGERWPWSRMATPPFCTPGFPFLRPSSLASCTDPCLPRLLLARLSSARPARPRDGVIGPQDGNHRFLQEVRQRVPGRDRHPQRPGQRRPHRSGDQPDQRQRAKPSGLCRPRRDRRRVVEALQRGPRLPLGQARRSELHHADLRQPLR
jgi:hypothetical protein